MKKIFFILTIFLCLNCHSQIERKNALLVSEHISEGGIAIGNHLVSYNFINGKLISKDTIISSPTDKGVGIGYHFSQNLVYKNRYVITGAGNVIDLNSNSLVMVESDHLVSIKGDSIIFYRDNVLTGTGYLICDLRKHTYKFAKKSFSSIKGYKSPNFKLGLILVKSELPYKIILNTGKSEQLIVKDCGYGTHLSSDASLRPNVPLYWIDNENFIYAKYKFSSLDHVPVEIHCVNVNNFDSKKIATIDSVPPAISNSYFSTDPEGKIIFNCSKAAYILDFINNKARLTNMISRGNGFLVENSTNKDYGSKITFEGNEIGRFWCKQHSSKTTEGFIGVEYGELGSNLGYPKGVKVWNNITQTWITIEINWVSAIVGWVEK